MSRQNTVSRVEEAALRLGETEQIEIVEVELKGTGRNQLLRVYIDKLGGVTHADCERVSHRLSEILDAEDLIPGHYMLEVSSPGIERKLKKLADFQRFEGKNARLLIRDDGEAGKNWLVEGLLSGVVEDSVVLQTAVGERLLFPFASIHRANLKWDW